MLRRRADDDVGRSGLWTVRGADGGASPSLYRLTTWETSMVPPAMPRDDQTLDLPGGLSGLWAEIMKDMKGWSGPGGSPVFRQITHRSSNN